MVQWSDRGRGARCARTGAAAGALALRLPVQAIYKFDDRRIVAGRIESRQYGSCVGAVLNMRVEDSFIQGRRTWVRLHEKGGKHHEMPCHQKLESYLHSYTGALQAAAKKHGAGLDPKAWLLYDRRPVRPAHRSPDGQSDRYRMIRRRETDAGIETKICGHSFRATGITEYLRNGGKLEVA